MNSRAPMIFALSGLAVLAVLLFRFWFSESGWFAIRELEANVDAQMRQTAALAQRNRILAAEVVTMKEGNGIVESRARTDLGMVAEGETFYVVVDPPEPGAQTP
ncbi:MAG: septum formation initiator family protein [Gammaproteobacteria bacterium]|nr:septum formation initiator family protein [Gammaproteobacteria bacterium]